jgi:plastocyanin
MRRRMPHPSLRATAALAAIASMLVVLGGCQASGRSADLANGKQLFVAKCGTCHELARAGTKGTQGPDLDAAFRQSRSDGLEQSTFRGVVQKQIANPNPGGNGTALMPRDLVKGQDAYDVATYVSQVVGKAGKDTGLLASIGQKKASGTVAAKGGTLEIDAAPAGLAYVAAAATAPAGKLAIKSKNPQATPHDIAIQGNGASGKGPEVTSGGVSQFAVDLKPGQYTFYCTVPGHREGGMVGKLTVK